MKEDDCGTENVRCVHWSWSRPGSQSLIERNEVLHALKVAIEAVFDFGLHAQNLAGFRCFRINSANCLTSASCEWV